MSLGFTCRCGTVHIEAPGRTGRDGMHAVCYCADCRAFALHLDKGDGLLPRGGSRVFQIRPDWLRITRGSDQIGCLRLGPKGPRRWYAACCRTPLAVTLPGPMPPFASITAMCADDVEKLGPVRAVVNPDGALDGPGDPPAGSGLSRVIARFVWSMLGSVLSGGRRRSPFFPGGQIIGGGAGSEPRRSGICDDPPLICTGIGKQISFRNLSFYFRDIWRSASDFGLLTCLTRHRKRTSLVLVRDRSVKGFSCDFQRRAS